MNYAATERAADFHADRQLKSIEQKAHEARIAANRRYDRAQSIAHDPDELTRLQADAVLDYSSIEIKVDSQYVDLFGAADLLRLRVMNGRHAEADCIARDMTDALAAEVERLIVKGEIK